MEDQTAHVVRRYFEEVLNAGNSGAADSLLTGDFIMRFPGSPEPLAREGWEATNQQFRTAFPDQATSVDDIVVQGDKAAARFTFRGTQSGEFMGLPATNQRVSMTGIAIFELRGGRIAEHWVEFDAAGLMRQLTGVPAGA